MASRLAIFHTGDVTLGHNPFGKDVANLELYRALALHGGFEGIDFLTHAPLDPQPLLQGQPTTTALTSASALNTGVAARAGAVLRGGPDLSNLAWLRRTMASDRAYSLMGMVHTLAPPTVRDRYAALAIAPIQPWDALICTSPSVQVALERLFGEWGDYLADRFGGDRRHKPHLPLIPLGVDQARLEALADRPEARAQMRAELGLGADDVLVIWVGRLSFFEKAFPQPMFRAVAEAARPDGPRVHLAMAGWFPDPALHRPMYEAAARAYAPNVPLHLIDGNDAERLGRLWAAADVFISLVDNIQETFGLAPVEAMAAGVPVVASDWDGYRSTIRDGLDGFLIPTLGGPLTGVGQRMAASHLMELESYQVYAGTYAQHTAVHVGQAAAALRRLIDEPELRRRMGASGRERVRQAFDWPVVARRFNALVDDLARLRAAAPDAPAAHRVHPVRGDPFRDFAEFATETVSGTTPLAVRPGVSVADLDRADSLDLDQAFGFWRAPRPDCERILALVAAGEARTVEALMAHFPANRRSAVLLGVTWMAKLGLIDWL